MLFQSRFESDPLDVPQITLQLVISVSKSDFVNEKLFKQWQLKQARLRVCYAHFLQDSVTDMPLSLSIYI